MTIFARLVPLALALLLFGSCAELPSASSDHAAEWAFYGHDPGGDRFSPLDQINVDNVQGLTRAWTFSTGEAEWMNSASLSRPSAFECTPLIIGNRLFLSTPSGRVFALDATTGQQIWEFDPFPGKTADRKFQANRGVAYWDGDGTATEGGRLFAPLPDGRLVCLNAAVGRPCTDFAEAGFLDLKKDLSPRWRDLEFAVTSPPAVYQNLLIVGALVPEGPSHGPSGAVRAFDTRTGKPVWVFHTVPLDGTPGARTWPVEGRADRTGTNVWSMISVDQERGIAFLPVGSPAYDFYGGDREGENLYGNCLVALDAATGKKLWHFQMVHHDIWDFDLPAQPVLVDVEREGITIPAVVQVTKMGFVYVLDRVTGEPIFPVEEQPVPQSTVPGEHTWATQPFPLQPPPLARIEPLTREELTKVTAESNQYCRDLFDRSTSGGVFEPAGTELTLSFPGTLGGATWSGASFDPKTGFLYVNVNEVGRIALMEKTEDGSYRRNSPWGAYARFWDENRWPCQQPPWGTLNAVDLKTGTIAWKVPLGGVRELEAKGIAKTGAPNLGGSVVTSGGVVFIAGTNDRRFRAFDSASGEELWTADLEASGHATPATYLGSDGRQYVVIAAGGGGAFSPDHWADVMVAYALPAAGK